MSLSFKKKMVHKTKCGGILSLIIYLFILGLSFYSLTRLFNEEYKENYIKIKTLGDNYGSIPLIGENFMLAAKFDNELFNDWNNPLLNVTLSIIKEINNGTSTTKNKNQFVLRNCETKHFNGLEKDFYRFKLDNALCPEISDNFTLEGGFEQNIFSYLKFEIKVCEDSSKCQNKSALETVLKSISKNKNPYHNNRF
jgi:hypothetical protein